MKTDFFVLLICICVTEYVYSAESSEWPPDYPWTLNVTGCKCQFDSESRDCACCNPGGCQCPAKHRNQCVQCNHAEQCGILPSNYPWTHNTTGCQCLFDSKRWDCACCNPGGCQCPEKYRFQCTQCNHGEQCGILPADYPWTHNTTGCKCYFDSASKDCACCNTGGCQCPQEHRHQCVQCNHGEQCGTFPPSYPWTRNTTGCKCYFNNESTNCACCIPGGCQCPEQNRHQCVQCDHGELCGTQPPNYPWTYTTTGCKCFFDSESTSCACCNIGGSQCPQENRHQCVKRGQDEQCGTLPPNYPWTFNATGCKCYFDTDNTNCACCNTGGCQCPQENRHQCVQCNHGEQCGTLPPNYPWTSSTTGCKCDFDSTSKDCACCNTGGCQCPKENRQQCVQCGHDEQCDNVLSATIPPVTSLETKLPGGQTKASGTEEPLLFTTPPSKEHTGKSTTKSPVGNSKGPDSLNITEAPGTKSPSGEPKVTGTEKILPVTGTTPQNKENTGKSTTKSPGGNSKGPDSLNITEAPGTKSPGGEPKVTGTEKILPVTGTTPTSPSNELTGKTKTKSPGGNTEAPGTGGPETGAPVTKPK